MGLILFYPDGTARKLRFNSAEDPYIVRNKERADKTFYKRLNSELSDLLFEEDLDYSISDKGIMRIELGDRNDPDNSFHSKIIYDEMKRISDEYRSTFNLSKLQENGKSVIYASFDPKNKPEPAYLSILK